MTAKAARKPAKEALIDSIRLDDGDVNAVEDLLQSGADPNEESRNGWSALVWAVVEGHVDIARLLIEKGADINVIVDGSPPSTLFDMAESYGHGILLSQLLIEGTLKLQRGGDAEAKVKVPVQTPAPKNAHDSFIEKQRKLNARAKPFIIRRPQL